MFLNRLVDYHLPGVCHCCYMNRSEYPFTETFLEDSKRLFEKSKLRYLQELWLCLKGFIATNVIYYDVRYLEPTLAKQLLLKFKHRFMHVELSILGTIRCPPECLPDQQCSELFENKIRATKKHNVPWPCARIFSEDASLLQFCSETSSLAIHCNKMDYDRLERQITSSPCWASLQFLECNLTGAGKNLFELNLPCLKAFYGSLKEATLRAKFLLFNLHMPKLIFFKADGFKSITLWTSPSLKHIHLYSTKLVILGSTIVYPHVVTSHQRSTVRSHMNSFRKTITGCVCFTKTKFLTTNINIDVHNYVWTNLEVAIFSEDAYTAFTSSLTKIKMNNVKLIGLFVYNYAPIPSNLKTYFPNARVYTHSYDIKKEWEPLVLNWMAEQKNPFYCFNNDSITLVRNSFFKYGTC